MVENGQMKKEHITLTEEDRKYLETLTSKGKLSSKLYNRALGLLELDRGKTFTAVSETLGIRVPSISSWAKKYKAEGIKSLDDRLRSGRPIEIDGNQRAKVTALACSEAPEGYAQWSLRLLADKAIELGYCEHISHTEVGQILKKTN
jgi:putative transposase